MNRNMNPDSEVESLCKQEGEDDEKKWKRPPSSYGAMESDIDVMEEEEEEGNEEETCPAPPVALPGSTAPEGTGLQMIRSASPETLYTVNTQQTRPPGAVVIDTRSTDLGDFPEDSEEDADEVLAADSPEPPVPVEPDDTGQSDDRSQPGRLHPEQDLPHIFKVGTPPPSFKRVSLLCAQKDLKYLKSIQAAVSGLTKEELLCFKISFYQWEPEITQQQVMEGDVLDFVDRILETLGQDRSLLHTISTLKNINKTPEAEELQNQCKRALTRLHLKQFLTKKYQVIREGVVQAGRHHLLDSVYVEPQISTCGHGGVDPSHEFLPHPPSPLAVPSAATFVALKNLFRLQKGDGEPVRTVLTTGIPGIGLSTSVGKFCMDWAELRANKDLQFVFTLSFRTLWRLRNKPLPLSDRMSVMEVIEYYHPACKDMKYLEEEDCKFLIIMDSFDCYQASLDWQNAPVIKDNYTKAHPDVLIVNIIRGTLLRGARVWILGRRAAVSQIPCEFIDVVTEVQGFSDQMKDEFLTKRFSDAQLAANIVAHYKLLPSLSILARHPFVCWMVATVFEHCFRYQGYGERPPRLTPFYVNIMVIQTNRMLQFYYGKTENDLKWSADNKQLLINMGKMAFTMLQSNTSVFLEEDLKENSLEVTVLSGLCTELPADGQRTFCFMHFSFQEFMAAVYVFTMFHTESKNVLDSSLLHKAKMFMSKDQSKSVAGLVQCAVTRTLASPPGRYDMFLRFLCGLLSPECHDNQLRGFLYGHDVPRVAGLDEVQRLLEQTILTAAENNRDRVENLKECLREMTQKDE